MSAYINVIAKSLYEQQNAIVLPARIFPAAILLGKTIITSSSHIQTAANSLSILSKIPLLGMLPYEKIATRTLAWSNFAVALSNLVKLQDQRTIKFSPTPAGGAIAAGATLSAVKILFDEHVSRVTLPSWISDVAIGLWSLGSMLSLPEVQKNIDFINQGSDPNKEKLLSNLKTIRLQLVIFAASGVISLLGRYIAALRSPIVQIALKAAPIGGALVGVLKNAPASSSQVVNYTSFPSVAQNT